VITGLRFDGRGNALGAARIAATQDYRDEENAGRYLYTSNASPLRRLRCGLTGRSKNTANTAMWYWQGRLYAQVETSRPIEIDRSDCSVIGESDLGGVLGNSFSAHPHHVPARRATYNFALHYGPFPGIDLYELPEIGNARRLTRFALPWNSMVHDFMVTARHAVFVIGPARLRLMMAAMQQPPFDDWFSWEPELGSEIIVVDLDNPSRVRRIATDAFWCWHLANGWDDGGCVIIDLARYRDLASLRAISNGTAITPPVLQRMTINLGARTVRIEARPDDNCEFPRVHPAVEGSRHRFVWGIHGNPEAGREGIVRYDLDGGTKSVWWTDPGGYTSEPILAPRPGAHELDAWVLAQSYDRDADAHFVAVLDARRPEDGPVAKVWFNQPLPTPFHGTWVPGA
jgi:all-trans-8'-apo-beta-carotenal 15,15'-oxygenase